MRETGYELDEIGGVLSWGAARSFLTTIRPDSRLAYDLNPDVYAWSSISKTNAILADIYDRLADLNANLIALGSGKKAKKPTYYPRPGDKKKEEKHIGSGALTLAEMDKWLEERRRVWNARYD